MSDSKKMYKRLPGGRSALLGFARNSLWMAEDHLLHVINRGYTEEYKRFYFRDVQSVVVRKTATGRILALLLGTFAALSGILLFLGWKSWGWGRTALWISEIHFSFWLALFLIHLIRGTTCSCALQTAVQLESLPSLHRLRAARTVLRILKQKVDSVQGTVLPEVLAGISAEQQSGNFFPRQPEIVEEVTEYRSHAHVLLFSVLILDGIRLLANLLFTRFLFYGLGLIFYVLAIALVILSLIKQRNSNLSGVTKGIVWCTLIYLWMSAAAWYVYGIFVSIDRPDAGLNYWELLRSVSQKPVLDSAVQLILHSFSAFCSLLFGIAGLFSIRKFYRS